MSSDLRFRWSSLATGMAVVAVLVVFWVAIASALWGFSVATAGVFGRGEATKRLQSASYRIAAYDHFFDLCVSVQNAEASLDAQFDLLPASDGDTKRLVEINIAALKATRGAAINQYNADAKKDYTLGQFRDSGLPYQLPVAPYDQKGSKTQCAI